MPDGKPAGVRCVHLDEEQRCQLFGRPERPAWCAGLQPEAVMCGDTPAAAVRWLTELERQTAP